MLLASLVLLQGLNKKGSSTVSLPPTLRAFFTSSKNGHLSLLTQHGSTRSTRVTVGGGAPRGATTKPGALEGVAHLTRRRRTKPALTSWGGWLVLMGKRGMSKFVGQAKWPKEGLGQGGSGVGRWVSRKQDILIEMLKFRGFDMVLM